MCGVGQVKQGTKAEAEGDWLYNNIYQVLQFPAVSAALMCSFTDEVHLYLDVLNKYFLHYSLLAFLTLFFQ